MRDIQSLKKFEPQIWLGTLRMSENELVQKSYKGAFSCKPLYQLRSQGLSSYRGRQDETSWKEVAVVQDVRSENLSTVNFL